MLTHLHVSPHTTPSAANSLLHGRVDDHLHLVRAAAAGVCRRSGGHPDRDELMSAGFSGLVEAAHRYRPGGGAGFATFAYYRIVGAMRDELRAGRSRGNPEHELIEAAPDPAPSADAWLAARDALAAVTRALGALPARERALVERCYLEGVPLATAAAELGVSISRASRLRSRALATLRAGVLEEGAGT